MIIKKAGKAITLFVMMLLLFVVACKKSEQPPEPEAEKAAQVASEESRAPGQPEGAIGRRADKSADIKDGIKEHFVVPFDKSKDRLLEYKISLTYDTKNLHESRLSLLALTAKYGFVKSSSTNAEGRNPSVSANIFIKTESLYEALKDFDSIGKLVGEQISVVDHTEEMALSERKIKREQLRGARRNAAAGQVAAAAKNWKDIEDSIERSENQLDSAEHEKWKIKDKISWAEINLYLKGPVGKDSISVPKFFNALVGIVNTILYLLYIMVWMLPFLAIIGVAWYYRAKLKDLLRRGKK
ncbi:MAG: DUF4349 domain-containing protein [Spirochaetes bacterium]|jgi:hypothetical protein|nr:DUF4349 domain-containing protein [Spirochaetota bacterium]